MRIAITNATIINEGRKFKGCVLIDNGIIEQVETCNDWGTKSYRPDRTINAEGLWLIPGVIDDQVHFREPGLTHKGDIYSESKAAIAGGVTSYMEMPNTKPQTTTIELLDDKFALAAEKSLANFSFYLGATNDNLDQLAKINPHTTCGVKVFMGSSTGNMLVDNNESLDRIFKVSPVLIATHCEDETTIRNNTEVCKKQYGENPPFSCHAAIRDEKACYESSSKAVALAKKHGSRLHILHLSTAKELSLLSNDIPLMAKQITGEVCVHHLWFNSTQYDKLGWRIKWNPSVKSETDRLALIEGLKNNLLDVVATDHAPHLIEEKRGSLFKSASGGPMIQHSLIAMIELCRQGYFPIETVVEKMCHAPATLFRIDHRGYIREGYHADLVLVNPNAQQKVTQESLLYKCKWSAMEGEQFSSKVIMTIVNGRVVYEKGKFDETVKGEALRFNTSCE